MILPASHRIWMIVSLVATMAACTSSSELSSKLQTDAEPSAEPAPAPPADEEKAEAKPAAQPLTSEECDLACENLIRITLSEIGELAFQLPPDAVAKPRSKCLEACNEAGSESDVQKMRCLVASQATSTGELTNECGLDLKTKAKAVP